VYVLRAAPERSRPIVYYISSRTFLVAGMQANGGSLFIFSDYRVVDGVRLPFMVLERTPGGQRIVSRLERASFDVRTSPHLFRSWNLEPLVAHRARR
jgi:hypothetical protein